MNIFKINHVPSRKFLFSYILENKLLNECSSEVKDLFELFEYENNPIILAKKACKLINKIKDNEFPLYQDKIKENLIIRCVMLMPKIYKSISYNRIINLFTNLNLGKDEIIDIISEASRNNYFKCKIDIKNDIIKFFINESSQVKFNELLENFLKNSKKAMKDIISHRNVNQMNILKDKIYEEIRKNNTDSLKTTNQILEETKAQNKKLK